MAVYSGPAILGGSFITTLLYQSKVCYATGLHPEGLFEDDGEKYGFTGRLAKIVAPSKLGNANAGSNQALFPIMPGRQTQIVNINRYKSITIAKYIQPSLVFT